MLPMSDHIYDMQLFSFPLPYLSDFCVSWSLIFVNVENSRTHNYNIKNYYEIAIAFSEIFLNPV